MNLILDFIGFVIVIAFICSIFFGFVISGNIYIYLIYKALLGLYVGRKIYKLFK